jgi:cytochrome c peroxidase
MNRSQLTSAAALLVVASAALLAACEEPKPNKPATQTAATAATAAKTAEAKKAADIDPDRLAQFAPLPATMDVAANPTSDAKVQLGRMLYFENRLSKNHDFSCNSCHDLANFGGDGKEVSTGHNKQAGTRNSPTVYNAAGHFAQFWDGRAATVEEQAKGPLTNPKEMASDEKRVVETLKSMPEYVDAFKKAFPDDKDAISLDNVGKAIGAFERKLVTPAKWDKYLKGDKSALSDKEKAGFNAFVDATCVSCHTGPYLGGALYQKAGLVKPWPNQKDQGRFDITKKDEDKMMFKVPGLRNITKTAPYFHDGSGKTLEQAIKDMATLQSSKELKDDEVKSIVAFLETLTGDPKELKDLVTAPTLPKSTAKTPKPDPK